jgi:hypothetical protein
MHRSKLLSLIRFGARECIILPAAPDYVSGYVTIEDAVAAGGATGSQQSGAECVGRRARYGHPQQAQTAAVKHVMEMQPAGLLGPLAELGSVQDTRLSALLSAHLWTSLRTLVVESSEARCAET